MAEVMQNTQLLFNDDLFMLLSDDFLIQEQDSNVERKIETK